MLSSASKLVNPEIVVGPTCKFYIKIKKIIWDFYGTTNATFYQSVFWKNCLGFESFKGLFHAISTSDSCQSIQANTPCLYQHGLNLHFLHTSSARNQFAGYMCNLYPCVVLSFHTGARTVL